MTLPNALHPIGLMLIDYMCHGKRGSVSEVVQVEMSALATYVIIRCCEDVIMTKVK